MVEFHARFREAVFDFLTQSHSWACADTISRAGENKKSATLNTARFLQGAVDLLAACSPLLSCHPAETRGAEGREKTFGAPVLQASRKWMVMDSEMCCPDRPSRGP